PRTAFVVAAAAILVPLLFFAWKTLTAARGASAALATSAAAPGAKADGAQPLQSAPRLARMPGGSRENLGMSWTIRGHVSRGRAPGGGPGAAPGVPVPGRIRDGYATDGAILVEDAFTSDASGAFAWDVPPPDRCVLVEVEAELADHDERSAMDRIARGDPP